MSERKRRKNYSGAEKAAIVREHLLEKVPISDLCDRHGIQPSQFYAWQKQLFEQAAKAFERGPNGRERELERKIKQLEERGRKRDEVIVEITHELVKAKKEAGEL
jgi:transposase